jgi:outer membrane protein assembly factor BamD (BamD/ComL family)
LLDLDRRHERYAEHLETLKAKYPNCQIEDNIELEIGKATASLTARIDRLEALLRNFSRGDAAAEALLRLGMAYQTGENPSRSDEALARLAQEWPDSIWTRQAAGYVPWTSRTRLTKAGS